MSLASAVVYTGLFAEHDRIWRLLKETYHDRRKRFTLRFNLIVGLTDAGLDLRLL